MSILISGRAFCKSVLEHDEFVVPKFALAELNKYNGLITDKTRLTLDEHIHFAYAIFSKITVLPYYLLQQSAVERAFNLVGLIDPKDVSYLALAIQTDTILLTRDRPIYVGARKKGFRKIMLFDSFLRKYL